MQKEKNLFKEPALILSDTSGDWKEKEVIQSFSCSALAKVNIYR